LLTWTGKDRSRIIRPRRPAGGTTATREILNWAGNKCWSLSQYMTHENPPRFHLIGNVLMDYGNCLLEECHYVRSSVNSSVDRQSAGLSGWESGI
jgi:hypothetical protein